MSDENQYNSLGDAPPPAAVLLRLEADGELPDEWRGELQQAMQADPHAEDRIAFERALRFRVSKVMARSAPQALAERVRASLAEAETEAEGPAGPAGRIGRSSREAEPTTPAYSFRQRLTRYALAAVLALLVGVSGFIAWQGRNGLRPGSDLTLQQASTRVFNFVESQAHVCGNLGRIFERKMKARQLGEVPSLLSDHLGMPAPAQSLTDCGYRFRGAGKCGVPFYGPSLHYVYTRTATSGEVPLSLFVQHGTPPVDMQEGSLYELVQQSAPIHVFTWCTGETIFYLVPAPGEDIEAVLESFAAPSTRINLGA